jgi:hypothetical protein
MISEFIRRYLPWLLPQFAPIFELPQFDLPEDRITPALEGAAAYATRLDERLAAVPPSLSQASGIGPVVIELRSLLPLAHERLTRLEADILSIAREAEQTANQMDYSFLLEKSRQLLSIGYDGVTGTLNPACYDLLASEARIASFLAVAKGDVPQQAWFRLDRSHVSVRGRASLISWTGTMFEYMMPALWMRTYPDTLISRSLDSAARIQKDHLREIPWGISESGCARIDDHGRYGYQAWGIPSLALKYGAEDGPVISPYSTFLTLPFLRDEALANLRRMAKLGWQGAYGFYEAADYTQGPEPIVVRSWMAHHQGMSLLSITNLLCGNIFQCWFHANPIVRATELLLHEKPLNKVTLNRLAERPDQSDTNGATAEHVAS